MKAISQKQIEKYYTFLNEMYIIIQGSGEPMSAATIKALANKYNVGNNAIVVSKRKGLIRKINNNYTAPYTWNTTQPTKAMAKALAEATREYHQEYHIRKKAKAEQELQDKIDKEVKCATATLFEQSIEPQPEPTPEPTPEPKPTPKTRGKYTRKPKKEIKLFWGLINITIWK